jgi:hypothetical protein
LEKSQKGENFLNYFLALVAAHGHVSMGRFLFKVLIGRETATVFSIKPFQGQTNALSCEKLSVVFGLHGRHQNGGRTRCQTTEHSSSF